MNFDENTSIATLINWKKESIDAIASIAPPLKRLKNPILRKIMASRVSVTEAAKMGNCKVEDFIRVLKPLGYDFISSKKEEVSMPVVKPKWLSDATENEIATYDARPILEQGTDPLKEILSVFKEVKPGQILCLVNSFVPTPLIHLLKKEKAEASFVEEFDKTLCHTYFLKSKATVSEEIKEQKDAPSEAQDFGKLLSQFSESKIKTIDVRAMEMPMPMQTILAELKILPSDGALFVHHKKVPVYLLEALQEMDYDIAMKTIDEHNLDLIIYKK